MEDNRDLKVLQEIHKGAKMGMDAIGFVSEKVGDPNLKDNLGYQYNQYSDILNEVNRIYETYGEVPKPKEITEMKDSIMGWTGVQLNTLNDKSNSHIADMLIQGTNMGIIEGRKLLNQNPELDSSIQELLHKFVSLQENNIEKLKIFL